MAAIFRAVPGSSRRCRSQREWLRAALAEIEAAGFYANRAAHYAGICRVLMKHMDWAARTSRPGHLNVAAAVGVSADTVGRAVAWLAGRGLLGLVSPGTTDALRPGVLYAGTGNLAAVYVLTVPKRRSRTPRGAAGQGEFADLTTPRSGVVKAPRARPAKNTKPSKARATRGLTLLPRGGPGLLHCCPETRTEGLAAAEALRERARDLRRLSAEHVRWLARAFFAAGWTPADVMHAIDHDPSGRQHGYVRQVRAPAGWARARLALWLRPDGRPLPSRSQLTAAARRCDLAEQAARRAARREPAGYAAGAALARRLMAARRRGAGPGTAAPPSSRPCAQ